MAWPPTTKTVVLCSDWTLSAMARKWPRHFVVKPSGFYFQATPPMRDAGILSEALGTDIKVARARAEALNEAWDEIRQGREPVGKAPALPGSFSHLVEKLRKSSAWTDKAPRTREELEFALGVIEPVFGPTMLKAITPEACREFYDILREKGSVHRAAKVAKWLRYCLGFAERSGFISSNPARSFKIRHPGAREALWQRDQVLAVIARATVEGRPCMALAVQIAYDTALRQGDILALTWGQFDGDRLTVKQQKTGKVIEVPLSAVTVDMIEAMKCAGSAVPMTKAPIIRGPHGRAYAKDHFTHRFRAICRAAKIPDNLQFRDIRRTVTTELAANGATAAEIAAVTGHSIGRSQRILDTYVRTGHDMAAAAQRKRNKGRTEV